MKAIVLHGVTEPEAVRLGDADDPIPGPGEAVVRVHAAALNHRDLFICQGQYAGLRFPIIVGSDGAGEVVALGPGAHSAHGHLVGDRVVIDPVFDWGDDPRVQGPNFRILGLPDNGTLAELVRVPTANLYPWPEGLSAVDAAALPLAGLTAYRAVATRGRVQAGETALVTGIGGGVATFALLIAQRLGARVLVTSGSDEKLARARELGADDVFNYRTSDWVKAVRRATGGAGPDLVIDGTGGQTFDGTIDAVRPGGRVVTYGATTGAVPELAVRRIFWKQVDVLGSTMGASDDFKAMLSLFGAGKLRPVVARVFPLAEAGTALRYMQDAAQFGKIVLSVTSDEWLVASDE